MANGAAELGQENLVQALIEENKAVLKDFDLVRAKHAEEVLQLKRDAASLMDKLLRDNAWLKNENDRMHKEREDQRSIETSYNTRLRNLLKKEHESARQQRILERSLSSLREQKATLEYQIKHIGAAFLALREETLGFVLNPVRLEADRVDVSWEAHAQSDEFRNAVIETVRRTRKMKVVMDAIDGRLVALRLLDPTVTTAISAAADKFGGKISNVKDISVLRLMGEKLVPERDLIQARKEKQLWQQRYLKQTDALARAQVEKEELLSSKTQSEKRLAILQAEVKVNRRAQGARMRSNAKALQESLDDTRRELETAQQQLADVSLRRRTMGHKLESAHRDFDKMHLGSKSDRAATRAFLGNVEGLEPGSAKITQQRTLRSPIRREGTTNYLQVTDRRQSPSQQPTRQTTPPMSSLASALTLSIPQWAAGLMSSGSNDENIVQKDASQGSDPSKSQSLVSRRTLGSPRPRRISTTLNQSEWDTQLAREIAALEKSGHIAQQNPSQGPATSSVSATHSSNQAPSTQNQENLTNADPDNYVPVEINTRRPTVDGTYEGQTGFLEKHDFVQAPSPAIDTSAASLRAAQRASTLQERAATSEQLSLEGRKGIELKQRSFRSPRVASVQQTSHPADGDDNPRTTLSDEKFPRRASRRVVSPAFTSTPGTSTPRSATHDDISQRMKSADFLSMTDHRNAPPSSSMSSVHPQSLERPPPQPYVPCNSDRGTSGETGKMTYKDETGESKSRDEGTPRNEEIYHVKTIPRTFSEENVPEIKSTDEIIKNLIAAAENPSLTSADLVSVLNVLDKCLLLPCCTANASINR